MKEQKTIREVQRLMGNVAAVNRFISRSIDRGLPFFNALENVKNFQRKEECGEAFENLKSYLAKPPLQVKPQDGERLYVYLALSQSAMSAVLTREKEEIHSSIYYTIMYCKEKKHDTSPWTNSYWP
ncbi:UNVERIFIED_CONTAM: hypothetical protein Slati_1102600 [Sesamum latifolium]|uniref:Reverse transcriptase/retrotransposon-derived protein RNase H-like domain-containing protein n=1 Tax=Sesamum latifolium TaxID=2727402 RepID=A0AAW2XH93_9LAMI